MLSFASIIDQERPVRILTTLLIKQTIPHALLFTGIEGVGKKNAALAFAMACNCKGREPQRRRPSPGNTPPTENNEQQRVIEPCSECRSCRKILSDIHPDIIHIRPSGPVIRIAQIRGLCDTLAMRPYEAKLRVVIISDAQAMNPAASNALLKMLEEPPDRTILILTALQSADLLPTIVSRCQHIRFNPVSRKNIADRLIAENDAASEDASIIAAMANGSLERAIEMQKSGWIHQRNWLLAAGGLDQLETLTSRTPGILLAFAEHLAKNRELATTSLGVMITWLRDIIVCRHNPEKVINTDMVDRLRNLSRNISVKSLLAKIEAIQTAQKKINSNSNLRLTLEVMMLRLAKDCGKGD